MSLLQDLRAASQGMLNAFGGNTPDWLTTEAKALEDALLAITDADATPEERAAAKDEHGSDEIEIDDDALASRTDEGTWVQAWVYVAMSDDEAEDDDPDCALGLHSWVDEPALLPADTACTRCGELYGEPK